MKPRFVLFAGALLAALAAPVSAASLIDLGTVTRDPNTNLDWLDLTLTEGRSADELLAGYGGYVASGYRIATWTEVDTLARSAGLPGLGASDTSLYAASQGLVSLLGPTYGDGVSISGIQGLAYHEPWGVYRDPAFAWARQDDGSYLGYSSTCCGEYPSSISFGDVGIFMVRDAPPEPPATTTQIRYSGTGTGSGHIGLADGSSVPFTNLSFTFQAVGDTSNYFDDTANSMRLIPLYTPQVTFSGPFGSVSPALADPTGQWVMAVGLDDRTGEMAFSEYLGNSVELGHVFSGPGLVGYDGLSSLDLTSVVIDVAEFDLANGNTWYFDSLSTLTFSATVLGMTAEHPLMPDPTDPVEGFAFDIDVKEGVTYYFDPLVAIGYDFVLGEGSPLITKAVLPVVGDSMYSIFALDDLDNPLFSDIVGGTTIDFRTLAPYAGGINGFALRGIDVSAGLSPDDPFAFVTGLTFAGGGSVSLRQTPISVSMGIPEPATWATMILGFGLIGGAMRRRAQGARGGPIVRRRPFSPPSASAGGPAAPGRACRSWRRCRRAGSAPWRR